MYYSIVAKALPDVTLPFFSFPHLLIFSPHLESTQRNKICVYAGLKECELFWHERKI